MALPDRQEIALYRGDTHAINVAVQTRNPSTGALTETDLTGATLTLTVRRRATDSTALIQKTFAPDSPETAGTAIVTLDPADTSALAAGSYEYDIQVNASGGRVYTVCRGALVLGQDVTA